MESKKPCGLFGRIQRSTVTKNISALLLFTSVIPLQVFADEQLFRQSKEDFSPNPYIQPDLSMGAFMHSVSVVTPPGRNGIQPDIKLTYNSSSLRSDSITGIGWSLNIPYIERLNKNGVDKLYNQDLAHSFFNSSLSGELLPIGTSTPVSGSFLGISLSSNLSASTTDSNILESLTSLDKKQDSLITTGTTTFDSTITLNDIPNSSTTSKTSLFSVGNFSHQIATSTTRESREEDVFEVVPSIEQGDVEITGGMSTSTSTLSLLSPIESVTNHVFAPDSFGDLFRPDGGRMFDGVDAEIIGSRTYNSKQYFDGVNVNGIPKIKTKIYSNPAHIINPLTKKFDDIDARISTTTHGWEVTHAVYQAMTNEKKEKSLLAMKYDGQTFFIDNLKTSPSQKPTRIGTATGNTLIYKNLLGKNIDLEVTMQNSRLIKEVVINDDSVLKSVNGDYLEIPFLLRSNDSFIVSSGEKQLGIGETIVSSSTMVVTNASGKKFTISPPVATASLASASSSLNANISIEISYTATTSGIIMTKRIPVSFLGGAVYPVRTDAIFNFGGSGGEGQIDSPSSNSWSYSHDTSLGSTMYRVADGYTTVGVEAYRYVDGYNRISRVFTPFDTSSIGNQYAIASATMYVLPSGKYADGAPGGNQYLALVGPTTQDSPIDLVLSDYSKTSTTLWSDKIITGTSTWATTTFVGFPLNEAGVAGISKTGFTKFGFRSGYDIANVTPQAGISNAWLWYSSAATSQQRPYLQVQQASEAPINLEVESMTNPIGIATSTLRFSAVFLSLSSTTLASKYQIQIATSTSSWASPYWDSGKQILGSSTPSGVRSPLIYATTTFPIDGMKYYWRIRFWDQADQTGQWSSTGDYFAMDYAGDFSAKIENGDMMKYHYLPNGGGWTAKDKKGLTYSFGIGLGSRVSNNTPISTYRWMLEKIVDTNGNSIDYSYATDTNQVYPSKITYTTNGANTGIYEVKFLYENRLDIATSSNAGFPVVTKQRLKEILVYTNGALTHRYQLSYVVGDNGIRSLLGSIQESGWNTTVGTTTLPVVSFTYSKSTNSFTQNTSSTKWVLPSPGQYLAGPSGEDSGVRVLDVNGDALPDFVNGTTNTWLNTGSTWTQSNSFISPIILGSSGGDDGVRLGDVNGDGAVDIVQAVSCNPQLGVGCTYGVQNRVYFGGTSGWSLSGMTLPVAFVSTRNNGSYEDYGYTLTDVNGDGLADITGTSGTYINNGSQWIFDSLWNFPVPLTVNYRDNGVRVLDVNGDGLADVVVANTSVNATYLNTGHSWSLASSWAPPTSFVDGLGDLGTRILDINGDGLADISGYTNTGAGWTSPGLGIPLSPTFRPGTGYVYDRGVATDDINGDGLIDAIQSWDGFTNCNCVNPVKSVWLKDGIKPDLLTSITNEKGGVTTVAYGRTTQTASDGSLTNPSLSIAFDTVNSVASSPGFGGKIATTTYAYKGGKYYYATKDDRQFSGFATSTQTNDQGYVTRTSFHQGDATNAAVGEFGDHISKTNKPYLIENLDQNNNLFARTINKWARADYADGRNFVKLVQSLKQTFDGDSTHRDTAVTLMHNDTNGNVIEQNNWGEVSGNTDGSFVDLGNDKMITTLSYATDATSATSTINMPSRELVTDQSASTVRDTKWYYDSLAFGSVSKGNQTKEERLKNGSIYASTTKTFNSYGNVLSTKDARGNTTTFGYDPYNLYPASSTNALSQTTSFYYDYATGKVATTTDANGRNFVTVFDGLGRPVTEKQPDVVTPATLVTKTVYSYADSTTTPSSIFRQDYLNSATTSDQYSYFDGFGRTIQTKKEAESTNGWITNDTVYSNVGNVATSTLPYFTATQLWGAPTSTAFLYVNNYYDAMGRVATVTNSVGSTQNTYNDWKLTTTDVLNNKKDFIKDAYGNLSQVVEYLSPTLSASTNYNWNLLGKMTKLTDALGNIRNFTYDNLGRLLGSEDLHTVGDVTFGNTLFTYDDAGNMTQKVTPNNQMINYTYDSLNRPVSEDWTGKAGIEIGNTYDTCTNGIGRLCTSINQGSATSTYYYNPISLVGTTSVKIGTTWGTTTTSYLRNGLTDILTYPNNQKVWNIYSNAGNLDKVLSQASGSTTWRNVIESTKYGPTGQPTFVDYGNNTQTTYTYDATKLYRLIRKVTVSTSTTPGVPESLSL